MAQIINAVVGKTCGSALASAVKGWWNPGKGEYCECVSELLKAGADIDAT